MPSTSVAVQADPQNTEKPDRPARISKRMQQAIALLTTKGMTQRAAAQQAGLSEFHLSRELKKPQIQVFIARKMRETIIAGTLRASARIGELVDAGSEHVSLDASKHLLAIAGIKPTADAQVSVNIELKAGYVIDLSEAARPQPMVIEHDAKA